MPTPFTHLEIAQRLLQDDHIPQAMRDVLHQERPAFLFGSIAPDARVGKLSRSATHFYDFAQGIKEAPWRVMVALHPDLMQPQSAAHQAFMAGYIAHLAVDENWSRYMVAPHFVEREWDEGYFRFYVLQILLSYMDERDLAQLRPWHGQDLNHTHADGWLAFAPDDVLNDWKDFISQQLQPGGEILTLKVFGERLEKDPAELRAFLDSDERMTTHLWDNVSRDVLLAVETTGYDYARQQMIIYLTESEPKPA